MAQHIFDTVLLNARSIVADRRLRLLGAEAVTARAWSATPAMTARCGSAPSAPSSAPPTSSLAIKSKRTGSAGKSRALSLKPPTCDKSMRTNPAGASRCLAIGAAKRPFCAPLMR